MLQGSHLVFAMHFRFSGFVGFFPFFFQHCGA